ncbi:MAG TPA: peptidylprolyl isomerase [Pseudomonadales bacterium]
MSLLIDNDLVVSIHYTLTNDAGETLDSSAGGEPLNYLHGAGNIIPGLENALTGKSQGDSLQVTVQPEDAYGELIPELVQNVPMAMFQGVEELEVGMVFQTEGPDGEAHLVTVRDIDGDQVTIDGNHPLAGQVLNFDVTVAAIRAASDEEIAHGHVH